MKTSLPQSTVLAGAMQSCGDDINTTTIVGTERQNAAGKGRMIGVRLYRDTVNFSSFSVSIIFSE